jgi:serine O-acetyltransferase
MTHANPDTLWLKIRFEAEQAALAEPAIQPLLQAAILAHASLPDALAQLLDRKLSIPACPYCVIADATLAAMQDDATITLSSKRDLLAFAERDPACRTLLQPLLFYKGFIALQAHRIAHWLWQHNRPTLAYLLQSRCSEVLQVDIHPAAQLGSGIFLDHATGIVIGETCVIGDDVSILQNVTLGGNGKERGDRHPKIRRGVLIGAGAKVLGNIVMGEESRIAAGSVVLKDVPPRVTVAGVPAKPIGESAPPHPAECMDHTFNI